MTELPQRKPKHQESLQTQQQNHCRVQKKRANLQQKLKPSFYPLLTFFLLLLTCINNLRLYMDNWIYTFAEKGSALHM